MKNRSKALLLALCALMLVVTTVFTTLAYLTDNAAITNTFTIGNVDIKLDETKVDANGDVVTGGEAGRTENSQEYKLFPGKTYTKDPMITMGALSEDAYVFVRVVDEIAAIEASKTVAEQLEENGWVLVTGETDVYKLQKTGVDVVSKAGDEAIPVFSTVTIKSTETNLSAYSGKTIKVTAYAVQAEGFDTAAEAWAAAKGELTA